MPSEFIVVPFFLLFPDIFCSQGKADLKSRHLNHKSSSVTLEQITVKYNYIAYGFSLLNMCGVSNSLRLKLAFFGYILMLIFNPLPRTSFRWSEKQNYWVSEKT